MTHVNSVLHAGMASCHIQMPACFCSQLGTLPIFGHDKTFECVQVFGGLNLKAGDRILTSISEYGSNFLAYLQVLITWEVQNLL